MNFKDLDKAMRGRELYHRTVVPPGKWIILRMDGRSFSTLTRDRFQKPFDSEFREYMMEAARIVLEEFSGAYVYTESDEISLLLLPENQIFDRELEKLVSVSASLAASAFTRRSNHQVSFDSRIWVGDSKADVLDYFAWRMADAERCGLNSYAYYALLDQKHSAHAVSKMLLRKTSEWKKAAIKERWKIDFDIQVPAWQKRGSGISFERYEKEGSNPVKKVAVRAIRYRLKEEIALPRGDDYAGYLSDDILAASQRASERA